MQLKIVARMLAVLVILVVAWRGFLWLIGDYLPTNTTVALIMTWASVAVLLVALFLDRIQSLKFKDVEINFKEKLSEAASQPTINSTDFDNDQIFARKGGTEALKDLLSAANRSPSTPILLVVNLRNNRAISISMLFTYLFFLNLNSNPVNILFVNEQSEIQNLKNIWRKSVEGVISGANVLRIFYQQFPSLMQVFVYQDNGADPTNRSAPQNPSRIFLEQFSDNAEQAIYRSQRAENSNDQLQDYLSVRKVRTWFTGILNKRAISTKFTEDDVAEIRNALAANDDYVLCFDGDRLSSIIILCKFATKFAAQTLKT